MKINLESFVKTNQKRSVMFKWNDPCEMINVRYEFTCLKHQNRHEEILADGADNSRRLRRSIVNIRKNQRDQRENQFGKFC